MDPVNVLFGYRNKIFNNNLFSMKIIYVRLEVKTLIFIS